MSTATPDAPVRTRTAADAFAPVWSALAARLADYAELTKPRIALMVLLTVTVGYALGCRGQWRTAELGHALVGIALAAASSSALNQYLERRTDARMPRTSARPLPGGRLLPTEVLAFGITAGVLSTMYLAAFTTPATTLLTLLTLVLYVAAYTPLKRHTSLCTAIGAVPGALPPVLGWTAAGGRLDLAAFSLFAILFLWQFPHFLAIAYKYRDQYERAGLRMLPAVSCRRVTGCLAAGYSLVLIPVSLLPREFALAGDFYAAAALILGLAYAAAALAFAWHETPHSARRVLLVSLVYLPALLCALTYDHWRLLQ